MSRLARQGDRNGGPAVRSYSRRSRGSLSLGQGSRVTDFYIHTWIDLILIDPASCRREHELNVPLNDHITTGNGQDSHEVWLISTGTLDLISSIGHENGAFEMERHGPSVRRASVVASDRDTRNAYEHGCSNTKPDFHSLQPIRFVCFGNYLPDVQFGPTIAPSERATW